MRSWIAGWFVGLMLLLSLASVAVAAEVRGGEGEGEIFRLPTGEVISDDLYVAAEEIFIDGIVEGDLVAAGGYIEVNGRVAGDVILTGGGIMINGAIEDDARLAGGGITIAGAISDDLFVAGGGPFWPGGPAMPIRVGERSIAGGVQLANSASVGGDAYIVGGEGSINGAIEGDLFSGMGALVFAGRVDGDAQLYGQSLQVRDSARVKGTLRYGSDDAAVIPAGVAANVQEEARVAGEVEQEVRVNPLWSVLGWLWRTVLLLLGFALLAWLLWTFAPHFLTTSTNAIEARPVEAGLYGLVAAAVVIPLAGVSVVLSAIFWGWLGGLLAATFLFGAIGLLWFLSPLLAGAWIGRWLAGRGYVASALPALVAGVLVIVLLARLVSLVPCFGPLTVSVIYLLSYALALGGLILARRGIGIEAS